jgi:hypothetical protein
MNLQQDEALCRRAALDGAAASSVAPIALLMLIRIAPPNFE